MYVLLAHSFEVASIISRATATITVVIDHDLISKALCLSYTLAHSFFCAVHCVSLSCGQCIYTH